MEKWKNASYNRTHREDGLTIFDIKHLVSNAELLKKLKCQFHLKNRAMVYW